MFKKTLLTLFLPLIAFSQVSTVGQNLNFPLAIGNDTVNVQLDFGAGVTVIKNGKFDKAFPGDDNLGLAIQARMFPWVFTSQEWTNYASSELLTEIGPITQSSFDANIRATREIHDEAYDYAILYRLRFKANGSEFCAVIFSKGHNLEGKSLAEISEKGLFLHGYKLEGGKWKIFPIEQFNWVLSLPWGSVSDMIKIGSNGADFDTALGKFVERLKTN